MARTEEMRAADLVDYLTERAIACLKKKFGSVDELAVSNLVDSGVRIMHNKKLEEHMDKVSIVVDAMSTNPPTI